MVNIGDLDNIFNSPNFKGHDYTVSRGSVSKGGFAEMQNSPKEFFCGNKQHLNSGSDVDLFSLGEAERKVVNGEWDSSDIDFFGVVERKGPKGNFEKEIYALDKGLDPISGKNIRFHRGWGAPEEINRRNVKLFSLTEDQHKSLFSPAIKVLFAAQKEFERLEELRREEKLEFGKKFFKGRVTTLKKDYDEVPANNFIDEAANDDLKSQKESSYLKLAMVLRGIFEDRLKKKKDFVQHIDELKTSAEETRDSNKDSDTKWFHVYPARKWLRTLFIKKDKHI